MRPQSILISGAGIAGSGLAYWLGRHGFTVTVVERATATRSSGNPVDVRGAAVDVAVRMGVMPRLEAVATSVEAMRVVDASGRSTAVLDLRPRVRADGKRDVEVPRGELAAVLLDAGREYAEYLFDNSIAALHQDADGVDVVFGSGTQRRFDLVVGADGVHSAVRRLTFGPEERFVKDLGLFVGTVPLGEPLENPHEVTMFNVPGRSASVHPGSGKPGAAFIFRGRVIPDYDYRDLRQHKRIIQEAYAGDGWLVPQLLEKVRAADELYFDTVSQVRIPSWSDGRVVLLGDAASSVSLFGEGSSLAIIGAATLADALANAPDYESAYRRFEATHRPLVRSKQRLMQLASRLIVPASGSGIVVRNVALRTMALGSTVTRRLRRPVTVS